MHVGEALRFSVDALRANRVRTVLTALGLVIGNASIILVVTVSLTSRDYILQQISGIGSNLVIAYFDIGTREQASAICIIYSKSSDPAAVKNIGLGEISVSALKHSIYIVFVGTS